MLNGVDPRNLPTEFSCPITLGLMIEPVIAADGFSYEKAAIEDWFAHGHNTSPKTGAPLANTTLIPNITLRNAIREMNEKKAVAVPAASANTATENEEIRRERAAREQMQRQLQQSQQEQQRLKQQFAFNVGLFGTLPLPKHEELMKKLAGDLEVEYLEVYSGTAVEQALVGFAGIYSGQAGAFYRRDRDENTTFQLRLANEQEYRQLIHYYCQEQFANLVISHENLGGGKYRFTVDSRQLFYQLSSKLGRYKKESHTELMQKFVNDLGVTQQDVYSGSVVEQTLVRMAGIESLQGNASYRRNNDNYTTYFNLSFANEAEYRQFNDYYNGHFPGLIINAHYQAHGLSHIDMNSRILNEQISPALGEFYHRTAAPRP